MRKFKPGWPFTQKIDKCDYCHNMNTKQCASCQNHSNFKKWPEAINVSKPQTEMPDLGDIGKW